MTDEKIIELYWNRDEQAISETSEKYGKYCHTIARNILYNQEDSEECVNDTYMKTWSNIPPHRPTLFRAFLGKLCRNIALNKYEYQKAEKRGGGEVPVVLDELSEVVGKDSDTEAMPERMVLTDTINKFLEEEDTDTRKMFVRRYFYLSSVKEIAEDYGFSESKVKMSLLRARKRLQEKLEKEGITL